MAEERTVQTALDVANVKSLPKVDSYYDRTYQRAYSARWGGYVSGMLMGAGYGAIVGVVAAFVPVVVAGAALPLLPVIGQSVALFASLGSVIAASIGTSVGVTAGAVSAGFEEQERREKLEKIREKNPELAVQMEKEAHAKAESLQPKNGWQRFVQAIKRSIDWKQVAIGVVAGLVFGAILAVNPMTTFDLASMGPAFAGISEAARIPVLTLLGGAIGGIFTGAMGSVTSNVIANAARPVLTGKIFEPKEAALEKTVEPELERAPKIAQAETIMPCKSHRQDVKSRRAVMQDKGLSLS